MVNIKALDEKANEMERSRRILKGDSFNNSISKHCTCGRFSTPKPRNNDGNYLKIDDALTKLRKELSEMQEQDKGIFQQLMKVSANVDRLRREIRLEEEAKQRIEKEEESDSESDSDDSVVETAEVAGHLNDSHHMISIQSTVVPSLPQKGIVDHQRCDSGIMADESDTDVLSNSTNVSQRRKLFEHVGTKPVTASIQNSRPATKCTVTVVDAGNLRRSHARSKSAEGDIDVDNDLVRLGKFQVHLPDDMNIEKRSSNPAVSQMKKDEAARHSMRKKNATAIRDGLLVDISENGELKLHNGSKSMQKTAQERHSEVRRAVFATLNSVQSRKGPRDITGIHRDDAADVRLPMDVKTAAAPRYSNGSLHVDDNRSLSHSHSSNGIVRLQGLKGKDIPRSRSMDGILDSHAEDDFVEYDDQKDNADDQPFRRYASCNYGARNAVQVQPRASGRIGYARSSQANNNLEDDAKAYFEALKSKKVMIRSISSASII